MKRNKYPMKDEITKILPYLYKNIEVGHHYNLNKDGLWIKLSYQTLDTIKMAIYYMNIAEMTKRHITKYNAQFPI
jgi:hypothetical protein